MIWRRQVWHVFRKDCRAAWPVYAVLVALVFANALVAAARGPRIDPVTSGVWLMMLLVYAIAAVTAVVLRADLVASPTAFWATLPIAPSAMATAKLAAIAVIIITMTGAVVATAVQWHTGAAFILATLPRLAGTVLAASGLGLAYGITSKERPQFGWVMFVVLQAWIWGNVLKGEQGATWVPRLISAMPSVMWLAVAALFVWAYRRLYVAREAPLRLQALVGCAALAPWLMLVRSASVPPRVAPAPMSNVMSARALWNPATEDRLEIAITTGDADTGRMRALEDGVVIAELRDGTTVRLPLHEEHLERLDHRVPPVVPASGAPAVIGSLPPRTDSVRHESFWVSHQTAPTPVHDVVRFIVEGRLVDYEVREVDRFPVRPVETPPRDGLLTTVRLSRSSADTAGPRIQLDARWLRMPERQKSPWALPPALSFWHLAFSLVSPELEQELPLRVTNTDGFAGGYGIPGLHASDLQWTLRPVTWSIGRPPVSGEWLERALVLVGTPVFHSAVRVRAIATISPP